MSESRRPSCLLKEFEPSRGQFVHALSIFRVRRHQHLQDSSRRSKTHYFNEMSKACVGTPV